MNKIGSQKNFVRSHFFARDRKPLKRVKERLFLNFENKESHKNKQQEEMQNLPGTKISYSDSIFCITSLNEL